MTEKIKQAIMKIWPRKPIKPLIPTAQEMRNWHYSQGPVKGYTYPKDSNEKN